MTNSLSQFVQKESGQTDMTEVKIENAFPLTIGIEIKKTYDGGRLCLMKFCVQSRERDWMRPDLSSLTFRRKLEQRRSLVSVSVS